MRCASESRTLVLTLLALTLSVARSSADELIRLQETLAVGGRYQVQIRVQLEGELTVPGEKDKPQPKPLPLSGESTIDYDERILSLDKDGRADRTVRVFKRIDFERQLGKTPQKATLRPSVRRIVLVRHHQSEVPFSPDGPLTWGEIDLLRTDVFTPALLGLLPDRAVAVGDRWKANVEAVKELTDFEQIEEGSLECRLERMLVVDRKRLARVSLRGTVRGTNEDGPARQQLEGWYTFHLDDAYLAQLSINGKHQLLNADGKEVGKVEGRFSLTRQPTVRGEELADKALKGLSLEPGAENTRLLYENDDLKVSFLYPRRWRVSSVQGSQISLDTSDGHSILLSVDAADKVPSGARLLAEARELIDKQKGKITRVSAGSEVQPAPLALDHFALEAEIMGQKLLLEYYSAHQKEGGGTLAARLLPANLAAVRKEVEGIARTLRLR